MQLSYISESNMANYKYFRVHNKSYIEITFTQVYDECKKLLKLSLNEY